MAPEAVVLPSIGNNCIAFQTPVAGRPAYLLSTPASRGRAALPTDVLGLPHPVPLSRGATRPRSAGWTRSSTSWPTTVRGWRCTGSSPGLPGRSSRRRRTPSRRASIRSASPIGAMRWPWPYELTATYRVAGGALHLRFSVDQPGGRGGASSAGIAPVPAGAGDAGASPAGWGAADGGGRWRGRRRESGAGAAWCGWRRITCGRCSRGWGRGRSGSCRAGGICARRRRWRSWRSAWRLRRGRAGRGAVRGQTRHAGGATGASGPAAGAAVREARRAGGGVGRGALGRPGWGHQRADRSGVRTCR